MYGAIAVAAYHMTSRNFTVGVSVGLVRENASTVFQALRQKRDLIPRLAFDKPPAGLRRLSRGHIGRTDFLRRKAIIHPCLHPDQKAAQTGHKPDVNGELPPVDAWAPANVQLYAPGGYNAISP
jgi:hypothetical protein